MSAAPDHDVLAALAAAGAKLGPGIAGALISLRFSPPEATWPDRLMSVAGGVASSVFVAPAVSEWLGASVRLEAGMGFAMGALGLVVLGEATKAIREAQLGAALRGWIRRLAGLSE